ncbi:hypothetical protein [Cecembia lonarensis]|uniref:Addiction module component n=1 Tax=Cecembia lonarensis (strain CCUG 58316 / KCTC 22772 / LW9) TaxID=1225176 RepID=K1L6U8_CECL9|nr:hypothetical protein [Cecembia lonarensis]EKB50491.1 hypothetical protein B879_00873 [Cecembia lonarensis LW9]
MESIEKIQQELIGKILTIKNKGFLEALNKLIASTGEEPSKTVLTESQREMLELSEMDIKNGDLISQEAMNKRNLEWLNEL